jgi:hypothetical protein
MGRQCSACSVMQEDFCPSFVHNTLLDDELVMWATSDGQRSLERVLKFTSDGMEAVSAACHHLRKLSRQVPIDLSMREWTRQSFAGLAWRVLRARPHLRRSVNPLLMLEINVACRNEDDNEERDSPHWQALVMTTGSEKQWSDRCWSPICLNTWAGVGRRFKLCRG